MLEVFADIWCPFAYVGLSVVRAERDRLAPESPIVVRAWPLELVNGAPMDVAKTAHHVHDLRSQLGVTLFDGFDAATFPTTTLPALALVAACERTGNGEAASLRVREALFGEGRDIASERELADLAAEFDVSVIDTDRAQVLADYADGQRRGVKGSPHFFCGARDEFCPSLAMHRDNDGSLHVAPDPARLYAFLTECLGAAAT